MIALLQRVTEASVSVGGERVAAIGAGLLVLVGVARDDRDADAVRLVERVLGYRVFADSDGRMNRSLRDTTGGGLLLVPQFTLAADTARGMRASFTPAAAPADGERLFDRVYELAVAAWPGTARGRFGADMHVASINDGPVTFILET